MTTGCRSPPDNLLQLRGVFVAGSLAWGAVVDKFRPDRWDIIGAVICLIGVAVIMYGPGSMIAAVIRTPSCR